MPDEPIINAFPDDEAVTVPDGKAMKFAPVGPIVETDAERHVRLSQVEEEAPATIPSGPPEDFMEPPKGDGELSA
jgi:hypothetical protein